MNTLNLNQNEEQNLVMGIPLIDRMECAEKRYEVNTVGMGGFAQLLNPCIGYRNELFGITGCAETMVWEIDANDRRKDPILHCKRYRKYSSAVKEHHKIIQRITRGNTKFFNGDGMPQ